MRDSGVLGARDDQPEGPLGQPGHLEPGHPVLRAAHGRAAVHRHDSPGADGQAGTSGNGWPYIDYPSNPNGSLHGITALTNTDGRVTIMMPHPERVARTVQNSYAPAEWGEDGPWTRMFRNVRVWVG